jgi:hypothetical protein
MRQLDSRSLERIFRQEKFDAEETQYAKIEATVQVEPGLQRRRHVLARKCTDFGLSKIGAEKDTRGFAGCAVRWSAALP